MPNHSIYFVLPDRSVYMGVWLGEGMFSFFLGGATYYLYSGFIRNDKKRWIMPLILSTIICWILTIIGSWYSLPQNFLFRPWHDIFAFGKTDCARDVIYYIRRLFYLGLLFPMTILTLALLETARGTLGKRISFLGDISYSSYLLHFPLQILFMNIAAQTGMKSSMFYSTTTLIVFFSTLIIVSLTSFHFFERPVQKKIRNSLVAPEIK